jgi:predicted double-glycine peptidase
MRRLSFAAVLLSAVVCTGALALSAATVTAASTESPSTARSEAPVLWIDVPFVHQVKDGCGSAAVAMVMQYWDRKQNRTSGPAADANKIQSRLFSPSAHGIYAGRIQQYFEHSGYRAFAYHGQWSDLERELKHGRPLIVALKMPGVRGPLHYAVVVGIDSARGFVFLNDPARGKMYRVSRQGFESEWSPTQNWALLAVPQQKH